MNWLLIIILATFLDPVTNRTKETLIKGIVVEKKTGEPIIGAVIKVGTQTTTADVHGQFSLHLKNPDEESPVIIEYSSGPTLYIFEVDYKRDTINLGKVEIVFNMAISLEEYKQTNMVDRAKIEPIKHYANLLGYICKNRVDSIDLISKCKDLNGNAFKYQYDSSKNQMSISYKDINCN